MSLEEKITKALDTGRLSLSRLGDRDWYSYHIRISPLVWARNLRDGYKIEVYSRDPYIHLLTFFY